ncbi:MAG: DUF2207 domain-containing protein [Anaerolineales bacterium]
MRRFLPFLFVSGVLAAIGLLSIGQPAVAQTKSLFWDSWDTTLTILPNGDLHVLERQRINFTDGSFTFGFREIPLAQTGGITGVSVSEPGVGVYSQGGFSRQPFTFDAARDGEDMSIRWYFPPTSNQIRTFDIAYTVKDAMRVYDSGDQLQWKAIATDRDFPIQDASVTVVLPQGAQFQFIDSEGVAATSGRSADGSSVTFLANRPMSPSGSLEVRIEFTPGVIPNEKPAWQDEFDRESNYDEKVKPIVDFGLGLLAAVLIVGGPALVFLVWYMRGRDPLVGPVPEYISEPPDDLPPGVIGTLIDEKADMRDVIATVVDLGRKGALRIEETNKKGWLGLGSSDFVFEKLDSDVPLNAVESAVMAGIFKRGRNTVELSDLRNKFYTTLPKIQTKLYKEMEARELFRKNPESTRKLWRGIGFALVAFGIGIGICLGSVFSEFTSVFPCLFGGMVLTGIAVIIAGGAMPAKTVKGSEAAARWKAFKVYLQRIDKHQDLATVGELFEKYLPYAMAFGIRDSFVRKFAAEPGTPMPTWWIPYGPRMYGRSTTTSIGRATGSGGLKGPGGLEGMAGSMTGGLASMSAGLTSMLNSTSRVMRSAPSSSGGGGFGGGGFGGGGGGGGGSAGFG